MTDRESLRAFVALEPELKREMDALHYKRDFLKQLQLQTILSAITAVKSMIDKPVAEGGGDDWQDDPAQDERWNAGVDFAQLQLCAVLKVDPKSISWDAATETLDGDVQSVTGKILDAGLGNDDWRSPPVTAAVESVVEMDDYSRIVIQNWSNRTPVELAHIFGHIGLSGVFGKEWKILISAARAAIPTANGGE